MAGKVTCCRPKIYASRVACCSAVSHGEYADGTDGQTDGRQSVTLRFALDATSVKVDAVGAHLQDER